MEPPLSIYPYRAGGQQEAVLVTSWQRAWAALGLVAPADVLAELLERYKALHRHYHSLQHLSECLSFLEPVLAQAEHPGEVELALWFHDAIYETRAKDNEARSAAWASRVLLAQGAAADVVWRVRELILATAHKAEPQGRDAKLLVDVDLGILGTDQKRFAEYERQVRAEYHWVSEEAYRAGRREVLLGFLARPAIYAYALSEFEQQARRNLEWALAALVQPCRSPTASRTNASSAAVGATPTASEPQRAAQPSQDAEDRPEVCVGMRLWWVDDSHRQEEGEVTVTKVQGNVAELSNGITLNLGTMCAVPDPISRGRCYRSREDKQAAYRLIDEWADFTRDVSTLLRPKGIDVEGIRALRAQLGIPDWRKRDHEDAPTDADGGGAGAGAKQHTPGGHVVSNVQDSRSPLVGAVLDLIRRRVSSGGATVLGCGVVPGSKADRTGAKWDYTTAHGYQTGLVVDPSLATDVVRVQVVLRQGLSDTLHPTLWFHLKGGAKAHARWCLPEFIGALAEIEAVALAQGAETPAQEN